MNTGNIIAGMALVALIILAIRSIVRNRKSGNICCGDCSGCGIKDICKKNNPPDI